MGWLDAVTIGLFGLCAAYLLTNGFAYLLRSDAAEAQRNREAACLWHSWNRGICGVCGKVAGT